MFARQCVYIKKRNNFAFVVKNHCKPLKTNQNEIEIEIEIIIIGIGDIPV